MAHRADSTPTPLRVVPRGEDHYPAPLFELADPPERLFVRGRWPVAAMAVAIVGARAATPYGLEIAARLGASLARLGVTVVSGLAHGIDAAAHRAALSAGGATLAILPGGLDAVVPLGNRPLAREIAARGTLLSEHATGPPHHGGAYLERNRLIAALSLAVVVVEARRKSGALNTAFHARRLGRPLLAVPGDVDRETSRGCHALLRQGARVCEEAADVLAAIEPLRAAGSRTAGSPTPGRAGEALRLDLGAPASAADDPAGRAARLLEALGSGARTAEQCAHRTALALPEVQAILLELEWAGLAEAAPGGRWRRRGGEQ